jgi:flagellar biosynthesis/type III secretory pathway protein FliH
LAQGIEQGERQARDAMQQEVQAQCTVLANVTQELHALLKDSKAFYEPMKRLAMHLAEQIVKSELKTSTHAIEQLIQHCLNELDHPAQGLVVIELNPEDKARLQAQSPDLIQGMRLEAVQDMQTGSVRLFANDTVIEDLVEHRLDALAESMLADVATWKAKSALAKPEVSAQDLESEDVHP